MCREFLHKYKYYLGTSLIWVLLVLILFQLGKDEGEGVVDPSYEHGVSVLTALEETRVEDVLRRIEAIHINDYIPPTIEVGDDDFKSYFNQSAFVGDSLVEAFSVYGYLDASSVVAKVGARVGTAEEEVKRLINLNPQMIFLAYGINDLLIYDTPEKFVKTYQAIIEEIRKGLPNAKVYVTSIFPVQDETAANQPELSLQRVEAFNEALKRMCEALEIGYLEVSPYITDEFYEPDGIHMIARFYPIWMTVVKEYIESQEVDG